MVFSLKYNGDRVCRGRLCEGRWGEGGRRKGTRRMPSVPWVSSGQESRSEYTASCYRIVCAIGLVVYMCASECVVDFLSALYLICVAAPGRIRSRHLSIGLAEPPSRLKEEEGCLRQPFIPLAAGE